jgi:hypothetical protein
LCSFLRMSMGIVVRSISSSRAVRRTRWGQGSRLSEYRTKFFEGASDILRYEIRILVELMCRRLWNTVSKDQKSELIYSRSGEPEEAGREAA